MAPGMKDIFAGADYDPIRDRARLRTQLQRVWSLAIDGEWRTVQRLTGELRRVFTGLNFPENSVQAQLRNLRKAGFSVETRRAAIGLYEYRVTGQLPLFVGKEKRQ
jgi:hypothetical protein